MSGAGRRRPIGACDESSRTTVSVTGDAADFSDRGQLDTEQTHSSPACRKSEMDAMDINLKMAVFGIALDPIVVHYDSTELQRLAFSKAFSPPSQADKPAAAGEHQSATDSGALASQQSTTGATRPAGYAARRGGSSASGSGTRELGDTDCIVSLTAGRQLSTARRDTGRVAGLPDLTRLQAEMTRLQHEKAQLDERQAQRVHLDRDEEETLRATMLQVQATIQTILHEFRVLDDDFDRRVSRTASSNASATNLEQDTIEHVTPKRTDAGEDNNSHVGREGEATKMTDQGCFQQSDANGGSRMPTTEWELLTNPDSVESREFWKREREKKRYRDQDLDARREKEMGRPPPRMASLGEPHCVYITYEPDDPQGRKAFIGQSMHGRRSGKGVLTWNNGSKYSGDWSEDQSNGHGVEKYENGSFYVGGFKNDARHGFGEFAVDSGLSYCGQWEHGQMHGIVYVAQMHDTGLKLIPARAVRGDVNRMPNEPLTTITMVKKNVELAVSLGNSASSEARDLAWNMSSNATQLAKNVISSRSPSPYVGLDATGKSPVAPVAPTVTPRILASVQFGLTGDNFSGREITTGGDNAETQDIKLMKLRPVSAGGARLLGGGNLPPLPPSNPKNLTERSQRRPVTAHPTKYPQNNAMVRPQSHPHPPPPLDELPSNRRPVSAARRGPHSAAQSNVRVKLIEDGLASVCVSPALESIADAVKNPQTVRDTPDYPENDIASDLVRGLPALSDKANGHEYGLSDKEWENTIAMLLAPQKHDDEKATYSDSSASQDSSSCVSPTELLQLLLSESEVDSLSVRPAPDEAARGLPKTNSAQVPASVLKSAWDESVLQSNYELVRSSRPHITGHVVPTKVPDPTPEELLGNLNTSGRNREARGDILEREVTPIPPSNSEFHLRSKRIDSPFPASISGRRHRVPALAPRSMRVRPLPRAVGTHSARERPSNEIDLGNFHGMLSSCNQNISGLNSALDMSSLNSTAASLPIDGAGQFVPIHPIRTITTTSTTTTTTTITSTGESHTSVNTSSKSAHSREQDRMLVAIVTSAAAEVVAKTVDEVVQNVHALQRAETFVTFSHTPIFQALSDTTPKSRAHTDFTNLSQTRADAEKIEVRASDELVTGPLDTNATMSTQDSTKPLLQETESLLPSSDQQAKLAKELSKKKREEEVARLELERLKKIQHEREMVRELDIASHSNQAKEVAETFLDDRTKVSPIESTVSWESENVNEDAAFRGDHDEKVQDESGNIVQKFEASETPAEIETESMAALNVQVVDRTEELNAYASKSKSTAKEGSAEESRPTVGTESDASADNHPPPARTGLKKHGVQCPAVLFQETVWEEMDQEAGVVSDSGDNEQDPCFDHPALKDQETTENLSLQQEHSAKARGHKSSDTECLREELSTPSDLCLRLVAKFSAGFGLSPEELKAFSRTFLEPARLTCFVGFMNSMGMEDWLQIQNKFLENAAKSHGMSTEAQTFVRQEAFSWVLQKHAGKSVNATCMESCGIAKPLQTLLSAAYEVTSVLGGAIKSSFASMTQGYEILVLRLLILHSFVETCWRVWQEMIARVFLEDGGISSRFLAIKATQAADRNSRTSQASLSAIGPLPEDVPRYVSPLAKRVRPWSSKADLGKGVPARRDRPASGRLPIVRPVSASMAAGKFAQLNPPNDENFAAYQTLALVRDRLSRCAFANVAEAFVWFDLDRKNFLSIAEVDIGLKNLGIVSVDLRPIFALCNDVQLKPGLDHEISELQFVRLFHWEGQLAMTNSNRLLVNGKCYSSMAEVARQNEKRIHEKVRASRQTSNGSVHDVSTKQSDKDADSTQASSGCEFCKRSHVRDFLECKSSGPHQNVSWDAQIAAHLDIKNGGPLGLRKNKIGRRSWSATGNSVSAQAREELIDQQHHEHVKELSQQLETGYRSFSALAIVNVMVSAVLEKDILRYITQTQTTMPRSEPKEPRDSRSTTMLGPPEGPQPLREAQKGMVQGTASSLSTARATQAPR